MQPEPKGRPYSSQESLNILIDIGLVVSRATGAAIALAECGELVCRAASGTFASDVGTRIDVRSGLLGLCFRTADVLSSQDVQIDDRVDRTAAGDLGARSAIAQPLSSGGKLMGVLEAVSGELRGFDDRAVRNLKGVADVVARVISSLAGGSESSTVVEMMSGIIGRPAATVPLLLNSSLLGKERALPVSASTEERTSVTRLLVTKLLLAVTLFSLFLTGGVIFLRQREDLGRSDEFATPSKVTSVLAAKSKPGEIGKSTVPNATKAEQLFASRKDSDVAQVTGIRFSSSNSFTEVAVGLNVAVHYDAHRFHNPERIYFDLHSTSLAPALGPWGRIFNVQDKFLLRVRVAQHAAGLTRVVLDTKEALDWSANFAGQPPQLLIRVGGRKQHLASELPRVRLPQIPPTADPEQAVRDADLRADTIRMGGTVQSYELARSSRELNYVARAPALWAIYITGQMAGSPRGVQLIDDWRRTGGNAIVFDIKDNTGIVNVPFEHPLNGDSSPSIKNLRDFVAYLHSCGMYAIGRIAVFRDERLVTEHPELAIRSRRSGRPWKEKGKIVWVDPSNAEVQQYNIALVRAAAGSGLDEVQLDYIRFPVQSNQQDAKFEIDSRSTRWRRSDVITQFVAAAYSQLHPMRVLLSLDVFGVLAWDRRVDIASTGQNIRTLAPYCNVISPMVYPSHFFGMDGYVYPGNAPQHFIGQAMKRFSKITANTGVVLRPWLQGFSWRTSTYSTDYVLTQIETARANGARGFLFWNAENEYREPLAALAEMRATEANHKGK